MSRIALRALVFDSLEEQIAVIDQAGAALKEVEALLDGIAREAVR